MVDNDQRRLFSQLEGAIASIPDYLLPTGGLFTRHDALALSQDLQRSNGLARVFVHPFFDTHVEVDFNNIKPEFIDNYKKAMRLRNSVLKIAQNQNPAKPPILILEEKPFVIHTAALMLSVNASQTHVFPTIQYAPVPYYDDNDSLDSNPFNANRQFAIQAYDRFVLLMRTLGMKSMIIGGANLTISSDPAHYRIANSLGKHGDIVGHHLKQCVGSFARNMYGHMDIQMSNITSPQSVSSIRRGRVYEPELVLADNKQSMS
ncbi:MAG: hypothetical protein U0525_01285 [Patescibacteria group bacterium]